MPLGASSRYEARRVCTETLRRRSCVDELALLLCRLPTFSAFRTMSDRVSGRPARGLPR